MPMYTTRCDVCGRTQTIFRHVAKRDENLPECSSCLLLSDPPQRVIMHRIVEAPAVQADIPGYQSPIDGSWIEGRRARNEDLRRNNCRPWEGIATERSEANKRLAEADSVFETAIEKGIAETYNSMSAESQRALQQL